MEKLLIRIIQNKELFGVIQKLKLSYNFHLSFKIIYMRRDSLRI